MSFIKIFTEEIIERGKDFAKDIYFYPSENYDSPFCIFNSAIISTITSIAHGAISLPFFYNYYKENPSNFSYLHLGIIAIPFVTNTGSYVYEIIKDISLYTKLRQQEEEKKNSTRFSPKDLEEKVETLVEEKKEEIKTKPIEIFDPWKVDIKELENIAYGGRR